MARKVEQNANYRGSNYRGESRHLIRLMEALEGDPRHDLPWRKQAISLAKQLSNHLMGADEHAISETGT